MIIMGKAKATELAANLNVEAAEEDDGWIYEVVDCGNDKAKISITDEFGDFVDYM